MKCDPTAYRMAWIILNAFIGYFSLPLEIGIKCPSLNFCSGWAQREIRLFSASASQTTICWGRASKSIVLFETFAYLFYFPSSLDWVKKNEVYLYRIKWKRRNGKQKNSCQAVPAQVLDTIRHPLFVIYIPIPVSVQKSSSSEYLGSLFPRKSLWTRGQGCCKFSQSSKGLCVWSRTKNLRARDGCWAAFVPLKFSHPLQTPSQDGWTWCVMA